VVDVDGEVTNLPSRLYQGHLVDDDASLVHGSVLGGLFTGHIHMAEGDRTLTIEPLHTHEGNFHSIIYADENLRPQRWHRGKREAKAGHYHPPTFKLCGLNDDLYGGTTKGNSGTVPEDEVMQFVRSRDLKAKEARVGTTTNTPRQPTSSYTPHSSRLLSRGAETRKRSERTCTLYLQTDHTLYEVILE